MSDNVPMPDDLTPAFSSTADDSGVPGPGFEPPSPPPGTGAKIVWQICQTIPETRTERCPHA